MTVVHSEDVRDAGYFLFADVWIVGVLANCRVTPPAIPPQSVEPEIGTESV
jgi:hypothetical protein